MIIMLIVSSVFEIGVFRYYILGAEQKDNMDLVDDISIFIAVFVVISIGSITNYKKEMKF